MKGIIFAFYILLFQFSAIYSQQQEVLKIEGNAQGTTYHITYYDSQFRDFKPEVEKILQDFDRSVSTYLPTSIISKINSNEKDVIVDTYFITCFNKAKEVWKNTNGAFDPTVYPLVNAWGFGPGKKQKIEKTKIDSILKFVGFNLIELKGNKIIKKDQRVALDFNAFAQGYSVDVVSEFLNSMGIRSYIVEIGGEVYARGKRASGESWTIGIEKPIDNKVSENPLKAIVKLENLAIATSGNYRRFIIEDGVKYAHHIDPKTGYPTKNNLLSASIFAKDCISSDANATGVLVMGLEKAKKFLEKHKELQAYLIYSDEKGNYQVYESPGLKSILSETEK
jgi:FAD:protein FMN transferase